MDDSQIEMLIIKYLNYEASATDTEILSKWIEIPENEKIFDTYVKAHYEATVFLKEPNIVPIKKELLKRIQNDKKVTPQVSVSLILKYAAVIVLCLSLGYIYNLSNFNTKTSIEDAITKDQAFVTIKLNNGDIKTIIENESNTITNAQGTVLGKQQGNVVSYKDNTIEEKLAYNTLTVPYGKRFRVVLSDGTKVHLNAGTSLKYPVKFLKGQQREVFLDGEAFFDVVKDSEHPFLVHTEAIGVEVLGTKFNLTSYPEDEFVNTVLVEGAVAIQDKDTKTLATLQPNYIASWDKLSENVAVKPTLVEQYIVWMEGKLILNEVPFEIIQKKLERQYNVVFVNNNKALKSRRFTARFDTENIDQVMESLSISASFKYKVENNKNYHKLITTQKI